MLTKFDANAGVARPLDQYQFDLDTQLRVEREINEALESSPSIYSDKVSQRAKEAWEERLWQNMESHRHFRLRDHEVVSSDRPGLKLHIVQFVNKLNSLPNRRFMLNGFSIRGMRGLTVSRGGSRPSYVMALDDGVMPEWSKVTLDEHGLVKKLASRGWRAALLTLLDMGLISETEMVGAFGFASGVSGGLFRKYLFEHRNHTFGEGEAWREQNRLRPRGQQ